MKKIFVGSVFKATKDNDWTVDFVTNLVTNTRIPFYFGLVGFQYDKSNHAKEMIDIIRDLLERSSCENSRFIMFETPRGVSANWNSLVHLSMVLEATDYVAILNDDVGFPLPASYGCWLELLIKELNKDNKLCIISPNTHWSKDNLLENFYKETQINLDNSKTRVGMSGSCFILKGDTVEDFTHNGKQLFDETYECQWEEVDMLFRLHKSGWKSKIIESIPIWHKGSKTISSVDPTWIEYQYINGKNIFHNKTGIENYGDVGHVNFEVRDGIFKQRRNSSEQWIEFLG